MQLRTEGDHSRMTHRQRLPRGYFKKRKHQSEEARPPDILQTDQCRVFSVNYSNMKFPIVLILWICTTISQVYADTTTIEPDLKVLSLSKPVTPLPFDLIDNGSGICSAMDIRFDHTDMERFQGCRTIEGSVSILLMDDLKEDDFRNYTFPELVEITGFLMLYRISGIKSLKKLFPNLAVIRGKEIFREYSLIIYENEHLEEIGLINLQTIERGYVRIEKNNYLCYADKIDWMAIAGPGDHYIAKNKPSAFCPNCLEKLNCTRTKADIKTALCWDSEHCQLKCNCSGPCTESGKCCDERCVGGCEEDDIKKCKACKNIIVGEGSNAVCRDSCPPDTFEYLQRRCVTKKQCYDLNASLKDATASPFIPYNHSCTSGCPPAYVDYMNGNELSCKPCGSACQKKCHSRIIDSIAAAQALKGCAIIEGSLEIQIRSTARSIDSANSIVKELENSLADIVEIHDYLKIARSFPIVSLSFLKKLRLIKGKRLESSKYAIFIWDNQNLQELFQENQEIVVESGKLFFHFNPKLCFYKIEQFAKDPLQIENYDTAKISNGDKTPCNVTLLNVKVSKIFPKAALLSWTPLKLEDDRALLSYVVYYIPALYQNVTLWEGRDACGNDGWLVEDVNDFRNEDWISTPLTKLEPYTQYAYYVQAYTLMSEKTGAQSIIKYFRTLPGQPHVVTRLKASPLNSSTVEISWEAPKKVNGKLSHFLVRAKRIEKSELLFDQRDYCQQPFDPQENVIKEESKPIEVNHKDSAINSFSGRCDCTTCVDSCTVRTAKEGEDQRQSAIDFEDEIQDYVYIKTDTTIDIPKDRAKRQVPPPAFPEEIDKDTPKKKEFDTTGSIVKNGEYVVFNDRINDSTQTSYVLYNLRHYTTYQIMVRACRENQESVEDSDENCSQEALITTLTMKKEQNDLIPWFDLSTISANGSTSIKVTWKEPQEPNGLLLSYTIRYKKSDVEHSKWEYKCVPQQFFLNQSYYILTHLTNGNYSVQIAATSMAGMGNYTAAKYLSVEENSNSHLMISIGVLVIVVILVFLVILYIVWRRFKLGYISNMKLIANVNPDYAGVHYKLDDWEVPRENVIQLHELGQGSFGMVYEGIIKDLKVEGSATRCAIKTVNENATDKERAAFLNEASVMKQFDTAFVVRLLGVVSISQPTYVVMELMTNGDLKTYLRLHRSEYDTGTGSAPLPPTLKQILQMSAEIADGMSYLSAKKFVHRDLAARNCMVSEHLTVKIGDFGMTRDIYETDYYRKGTKGLLPVRWMSPESLKDGVFTSSSDVFSYGVVLWEMATLASQPYQGLSNDQVLRYVIEGGVMERPEDCPDKLYELMWRCWQHRPSARPTFMEIIETLADDVNQNFKDTAFFYTKEGQDALYQQRQGEFAVNITDDVTTPLRQGEEETSSIEGNHFLLEEMNTNSDHKL